MLQMSSSDSKGRLGLGAICFVVGIFVGSLGLWTMQKYWQRSDRSIQNADNDLKHLGPVRMGEPCKGELGADGLSVHTYRRRTSQNEYELKVGCGADDRESQLHPSMRVLSLIVVPDKPATAPSLVADLAEIRTWCSTPCSLVYEEWLPDGLVAYSTAPKAEDLGLATLMVDRTQRGQAINKDVERQFEARYQQFTQFLAAGKDHIQVLQLQSSRLTNYPKPHPAPAVIFWMFPSRQPNDWRNLHIREIEFCGFEVFPLVSEPPPWSHGGKLLADWSQ